LQRRMGRGGSLVGGHGHVMIGDVEGAESSDIGKTIDVVASGNRAYTTSLRIPIILLMIGLFMAAVGILIIVKGGGPDERPFTTLTPPGLDPSGRRVS
jgi:hypothetical protein